MKNNSDSFLNDLDDETVEEISNMVNGMDDKMKDRIVKKCRQKMNQDEDKQQNIKVYRSNKWYRSAIATVAASLIIIAGIGFFSLNGVNKIKKSENYTANEADKESIGKNETDQADNAPACNEKYEDAVAQSSQPAEKNQSASEQGDFPGTVSEDVSQADNITTDVNTVKTDVNQIAAQLIEDYYKVYTITGHGRVEFDSEDYITEEWTDYYYCKVTDPLYTSFADIESLIRSCYTENAIEQKGLIDSLHSVNPWFVEQNGSLYVKDHPGSWPVNLTDTPARIENVSDDKFTAIKEYDNFGVIEQIIFEIVNTDEGWKIDSYSGDYENVDY